MRGVQWYQTCHMQTSCTHIEHTLYTSCTHIEHTLHTSCTHLAHTLHTSCPHLRDAPPQKTSYYIYKLMERPVLLLNAIFCTIHDPGTHRTPKTLGVSGVWSWSVWHPDWSTIRLANAGQYWRMQMCKKYANNYSTAYSIPPILLYLIDPINYSVEIFSYGLLWSNYQM